MLRIFIGHEPRVAIQTNVAASSLYEHSSVPVSITPLVLAQLPIMRSGLTEFSFARFLVPWLCGFEGWALFIDSDVIVQGDVAELFALADDNFAVQVCDIKPAFERAAVMLFNCGHPHNRILTPEMIDRTDVRLHLLEWTDRIGYLPQNWGHCVGYSLPRPLESLPLVHYTAGVPAWPQTADCEHAQAWHDARRQMCSVKTGWEALMGHSVHATLGPDGRPIPKYRAEVQEDGAQHQGGTANVH